MQVLHKRVGNISIFYIRIKVLDQFLFKMSPFSLAVAPVAKVGYKNPVEIYLSAILSHTACSLQTACDVHYDTLTTCHLCLLGPCTNPLLHIPNHAL